MKMTWNTLKHFSPSDECSNIKIQKNDNIFCDPFEVACIFNEYFTRNETNCSAENDTDLSLTNEMFIFDEVSEEFIRKELQLLSRNKSPGLDQLNPSLLKYGASFLSAPLTYLINTSLKSGCIPKEWKLARITPIFKNGDKLDVKNYRPIAVLSHLK